MKEVNLIKKAVKKIAKKAFLKGSKNINFKGKYDYYTDNDLACEKFLISFINKHFPQDNILSEETHKDTKLSGRTWIIDPIDGTHNYANGISECGIQVALALNGEVQFSIIYLPYFNQFYTCIKGKGVWLNRKRINTRKNLDLSQSLFAISTLTHDEKIKGTTLDCFSKINDKMLEARIVGCGCWEFVSMLHERFGAYILIRKNICKWDLLPGLIMCEENGLITSNKIYKGIEYLIVANNDEIFRYVEKIVRSSILRNK